MTIENRRALGGSQRTQCPCFLFGAKEASAGEEYRGIRQRFPDRCNETKTSRRQDGGHHGAQDGVITRAFGRRRPPLVRIACTSCPLSNCWIPSRSIFGKRTRASINRASHHSRRQPDPNLAHQHSTTRTPLLVRLFFLCTVHHQPKRESTTPHTGLGYYTTTVD